MNASKVLKNKIKEYWEQHPPGTWYSDLKEGSDGFFAQIEIIRYLVSYPHLYKIMEFTDYTGKSVLEVGCGIGTDILQFARNGAIVTGIDLTERAITLAKKRFEICKLNGQFKIADAENLPFEDETFDLVYSYGVLHHTPETQKSIDEIYRVLKKDGKAIIMIYHKGLSYYYNYLFLNGILKGELFKMTKQEILNKHLEVKGNSPLAKMYSKREGKKMFAKFGELDVYIRVLQQIGIMRLLLPPVILKICERIMGRDLIIKASK